MKNRFSFAILILMMALPFVMVSCSSDNDWEEESVSTQPSTGKWIEPYHTMWSAVDVVKTYMSSNMKYCVLKKELATPSCFQLVYSSGDNQEGILYSFFQTTGKLFSVIDTEPIKSRTPILEELKNKYVLVQITDDDQYYFVAKDKSVIVNTEYVSDSKFNVCYSFVSE